MSDRLVYITGASSGIGQALALHYRRAGWRLALVSRRATETLAWTEQQGFDAARVSVYGADVGDVASITGAGRACIAAQGLPDVVIACAGISIGVDTAIASDLEVMRRTYEINLLGMAATFQPFVGAMRERRAGTLVGIGSIAAIRGLPGHGAYCSSKAGVLSYCESLRGECRPYGVKVVTISPGYVATSMTRRNRYAMPFLLQPEEFAAQAYRRIEAGASYSVIPWQMAVMAKLLRALPNAVYDRAFAGRPRKQRADE